MPIDLDLSNVDRETTLKYVKSVLPAGEASPLKFEIDPAWVADPMHAIAALLGAPTHKPPVVAQQAGSCLISHQGNYYGMTVNFMTACTLRLAQTPEVHIGIPKDLLNSQTAEHLRAGEQAMVCTLFTKLCIDSVMSLDWSDESKVEEIIHPCDNWLGVGIKGLRIDGKLILALADEPVDVLNSADAVGDPTLN